MQALGDFIGGRFLPPEGTPLVSRNPAKDGATVLETAGDPSRIAMACEVAAEALPAWRAMPIGERLRRLDAFKGALANHEAALAEAIVLETGKIHSEALVEVRGLVTRFANVAEQLATDLAEKVTGPTLQERLRWHALGVVGVVGPFNFPIHLNHAHVVPALALGNTVVLKGSEITLLSSQRYAEAALAAGLPAGVFNVVQGGGDSGAALTNSAHVRGLAFTGSWTTGRRILGALLDRPEVLVALEMGGKNIAVVCEDADVRQAAHEIVVGGYLTTGQRCTCTDRVLVHEKKRDALLAALVPLVSSLKMGDPKDASSFAGPLATTAGRVKILESIVKARAGGAEPLVAGGAGSGQYYCKPSLHLLPASKDEIAGYTDVELFGPDLCVQSFRSDEHALDILQKAPDGLAHSVFTARHDRLERFFQGTTIGILNWNRSTNQASPRLPFGGVGKSGNYRPAGSFAPRNMAVAVAQQERFPRELDVHPKLAPHLVGPDLHELEAQHAGEDACEMARDLTAAPRVLTLRLPRGGKLPQSQAWLERLYAGGRVPRERKEAVFDHLRSFGPWFVSIDEQPLSILDTMSQTSTLAGGFALDAVVRAYAEGGFGETLLSCEDTSAGPTWAEAAFRERLSQLAPGFPHVTFVNSGAESNEKALALCRQNTTDPKRTKVLAFEGSFHGRTFLALHATYSPSKRIPFQVAGYEAIFAPFPVRPDPAEAEPQAPDDFMMLVAAGKIDALCDAYSQGDDALLRAELETLKAVDDALAGGEVFACIIEPMQCEGGDRYASARFFQALRLLTRRHQVPLCFDEVQTGFGLGGTFFWYQRLDMRDDRGDPDLPDVVTVAKRAQLGVVLSRFPDHEPTSVQTASLVRGKIHADELASGAHARATEEELRPRLMEIARRYPHLVEAPRVQGHAMAFELPSAAHLNAYLGQRFWRGAIAFAAGDRTIRYRLSNAFESEEIDRLFEVIRRSLSFLDAHPGAPAPAWEDAPKQGADVRTSSPKVRLRVAEPNEETTLLAKVVELEQRVYEFARRDPPEALRLAFQEDGIAIVAELEEDGEWVLGGCALGAPLERISHKEGPGQDPMHGRENTLYSIAVTVDPRLQGLGVGRDLKQAQLREAATRMRTDGSRRYLHVSGRNRVGFADAMAYLNRSFGAYEIFRLAGQYGDPDGEAIYYRMPVGAFVPDPLASKTAAAKPSDEQPTYDLASGIARPLATPPASLRKAQAEGGLFGPAVNKITLMNYVTPAYVRAIEWVTSLIPSHPHLYITSGRDETIDKAVRTLRFHRPEGGVAIGLQGGYVGHTTGATRSLSDPAVHSAGQQHFPWPLLPHPGVVGIETTIAALRAAVAAAGGPKKVLGLFFEIVQERTGRLLAAEHWPALDAVRRELDLPLVCIETASAGYRSGEAFLSPRLPVPPDIVAWWGGGQVGFVHLMPRYFVSAPLTMVSTWDGDELSLLRVHHQLRALRTLDHPRLNETLGRALRAAGEKLFGIGVHRVLHLGDNAVSAQRVLAQAGLRTRVFPNGCLLIAPAADQVEKIAPILTRVLPEVLR